MKCCYAAVAVLMGGFYLMVPPLTLGHSYDWSLARPQHRLVKTGGRLIKHARSYWLLLAEGHPEAAAVWRDVGEGSGAAAGGIVDQERSALGDAGEGKRQVSGNTVGKSRALAVHCRSPGRIGPRTSAEQASALKNGVEFPLQSAGGHAKRNPRLQNGNSDLI
jgi:hypothetical protein